MWKRMALGCWILAIGLGACGNSSAWGQVMSVVVGVTPSCPYGLGPCWSGARSALQGLDGVGWVCKEPDVYNCTAAVYLQQPVVPDIDNWKCQFKSVVGDLYTFRGVEVTVRGMVRMKEQSAILQVQGIDQRVRLIALEEKVQWNFKKHRARGPEPDERTAYVDLAAHLESTRLESTPVEVTGPLHWVEGKTVVEVRECVILLRSSQDEER